MSMKKTKLQDIVVKTMNLLKKSMQSASTI
jgi:hypothetical protein